MSKEKDPEMEQNAGIRKREEEIEKRRKQRIGKCIGFFGIIILLGAGGYVSRMVYLNYLRNEEQSVISVDSTFLNPSGEPLEEETVIDTEETVTTEEMYTTEEMETTVESTTEEETKTTEEEISSEETTTEENVSEEVTSEEITSKETASKEKTEVESADQKETSKEDSSQEGTKSQDATTAGKAATCISPINVNLRSKPSASGSVLGKVLPKATVTILNHDTKGWYYISYNGLEGYVIDTVLKE